MLSFLLFSVLMVNSVSSLGYTQSVAVKGRLICNGRPSSGTRVKLYDEDGIDMDDLMAEGYSDSYGFFHLSGLESEFSTLDPKLNVYHNCNDFLPCDRKFSIDIPQTYVNDGAIPHIVYDVGVLNLDGKFIGESRDCLNRK